METTIKEDKGKIKTKKIMKDTQINFKKGKKQEIKKTKIGKKVK